MAASTVRINPRYKKDQFVDKSAISKSPNNRVIDQIITENYALYNADCMYFLPTLPANSIHFSMYSPPFAGLYNYSSKPNDFSNCETKEQFLLQYEFLIKEIARVTKPGRISAVHITDIIGPDGDMWDFPAEVKKLHQKHGFQHRNTITVWKEPLEVRMRTMVKSLMHKLIVEDSTETFTAMPDYILIFKKKGKSEVPVTHDWGLNYYAGAHPFLPEHLKHYGLPMTGFFDSGDFATSYRAYVDASFKALQAKYKDHKDPKTNKLSHIIWQRYASSVWDDIRVKNVLPFRDGRHEDDEKHVHASQLDSWDRLVELYTNPGETVLSPFLGVGSDVYSPVSMGRKAIGIELKESYFKQAIINCEHAATRFIESKPKELFDEIEVGTM